MTAYYCTSCEAKKETWLDCHGDPHDGCKHEGYWICEEKFIQEMAEGMEEQSLDYFNRYIAGDR